MEMSPITGDLPEMDARRDRPGHDVVARRVLAVEHIWQHDYVLALLGLRHPRVGPRRAEPGIDLKDWPHLSFPLPQLCAQVLISCCVNLLPNL